LANFAETAWNFNTKFYTLIKRSRIRLCAEQNLIGFNSYKVTQFLVWPLSNFRAIKNVCTEDLLWCQNGEY